jgi:hypothetical protein
MGRTLTTVVPGCLNPAYLQHMVHAPTIEQWYLLHVEAGKTIYQAYAELDTPVDVYDPTTLAGYLNLAYGDAAFGGPWAFATLGGAGGQTIVGALSTGTHGGDFDQPPLADAVLTIHLVTDGGRHYWIEPEDPHPPLTDDVALTNLYGSMTYGGGDNFRIIRNTEVFNAVLVSVGRFGVIYSVVLKVVPQYALWERRRQDEWQNIKGMIKHLDSSLYIDPSPPPGVDGPQRFLQIAVSLTSHTNFTLNRVGITRRFHSPLHATTAGRAQRVGEYAAAGAEDPVLHAPRFTLAGRSHAYTPDDANPYAAGSPSMLDKACADASVVRGAINEAIDELQHFVDTHKVESGSTLGALVAVIASLVLLLKEVAGDERLGEVLSHVKNTLLDPNASETARGAGLLAWQHISYNVFDSQQSIRDYDAVSYAVMDVHDYLDIGCLVNVNSVEVFFNAEDDRLIAFIDALILFETNQEFHGKASVGYASLRFTGPTRATLGMQRWPRTCAVEVACLKDVTGGEDLIRFAVEWARNPNSGALLHWGQHNDLTSDEVDRCFGPFIGEWRHALATLTDSGNKKGFSSSFTRHAGLEVLQ